MNFDPVREFAKVIPQAGGNVGRKAVRHIGGHELRNNDGAGGRHGRLRNEKAGEGDKQQSFHRMFGLRHNNVTNPWKMEQQFFR